MLDAVAVIEQQTIAVAVKCDFQSRALGGKRTDKIDSKMLVKRSGGQASEGAGNVEKSWFHSREEVKVNSGCQDALPRELKSLNFWRGNA